jgi:TolB-like protein/Tfp pilus assembly protein PilF
MLNCFAEGHGASTNEMRKLAAILAADVVGFSRLAATDEERTIARLRGLRTDLIDPAISVHHGRVVKRTGDGILIEFRSVVDAVRCAIEVQDGMVERNAGLPPERQILFRVGIHLGDVIEEADGDLMGDGVNIAARLEGICQPGAICLSEHAYLQVRSRSDMAVRYLGSQELKNIPEPVHAFSLKVGEPAQAKPEPTEADGPPRLSVVVLPFANIGGDPEQEYFVDGVTASLTTDLSRISGSFVIGRNTAFTYKGKHVDLKQIGHDLGVRYVLEGSVQRGGNRLRVNVQLIDAESGTHLWAERFDKPVADLFEMQDEIVARLANQLKAQLIAAEARQAEQSPLPDSMDLYFQAQSLIYKGTVPAYFSQAGRYLEQALALDPDNVPALVCMAQVHTATVAVFGTEDRKAHFAGASAALAKALSLAPDHPSAHYALGTLHLFMGRPDQAITELEHSLTLDRNLASAHDFIGLAKLFLGRAEETEAHVQEALRISPRDTLANVWMDHAGQANLHLGRDAEALVWLRRSIEANRNYPIAHFMLGAALMLQGKSAEAQEAARVGLVLAPDFAIARMYLGTVNNPTYRAQRDRIYAAMRNAGVP